MSPSEFDLRAALHDGEGDDVNVDQLVLAARAGAASRRARLLSTAAIVAVVAGAGVGGAVLASSGNDSNTSPTAAAGAARMPEAHTRLAPRQTVGAGASGGVADAPAPVPAYGAAAGTASQCPGAIDAARQPVTAQLDVNAPLFSKPVRTLVVCSYSAYPTATKAKSGAGPASFTLRGADARLVTDSLEAAAKSPPKGMCPDIRSAAQRNLVFRGFSSTGAPAGEVTVSLAFSPCDVRVTNGHTVRYGWNPPAVVARLLGRAALAEAAASPATPRPSSSPS